jgi:hypothetical protein
VRINAYRKKRSEFERFKVRAIPDLSFDIVSVSSVDFAITRFVEFVEYRLSRGISSDSHATSIIGSRECNGDHVPKPAGKFLSWGMPRVFVPWWTMSIILNNTESRNKSVGDVRGVETFEESLGGRLTQDGNIGALDDLCVFLDVGVDGTLEHFVPTRFAPEVE